MTCSICLFISKILFIFETQILPFIKLLTLFVNKLNNKNDQRDIHEIISCSIYQISITSLSIKQRRYFLSTLILKYQSYDEFMQQKRDKQCSKQTGSDIFILEALWPFLHQIAMKANTNLKEVLEKLIMKIKSANDKQPNYSNLISNFQRCIDEVVCFLYLSLRLFCSMISNTTNIDGYNEYEYIDKILINDLVMIVDIL